MSEARKLYFRVMLGAGSKNRTPHSLGKCIEWKLNHHKFVPLTIYSPHSLGKCIEWKLRGPQGKPADKDRAVPPHSLGKCIEWKRYV